MLQLPVLDCIPSCFTERLLRRLEIPLQLTSALTVGLCLYKTRISLHIHLPATS